MREEARAAMAAAYDILPTAPTKEYFDLLILTGDYEDTWGSPDAAEASYTEVIQEHKDGDREHSEILARALSKRAAVRAKLKNKRSSSDDYNRAADLWQLLDEPEAAAKARWALIELESAIDKGTLRLFHKERSCLVRYTGIQIYLERLQSTKALARRSRPTGSHVDHYLSLARKKIALDYPDM